MCHPTAAIEVPSVSFCVCVWESEFANAGYQRGGECGPAINTAIRGSAGLWADRGPTECFITSSHSEFVPSLRSPSPIITTERLSTAREHSHKAEQLRTRTCTHTGTHTATVCSPEGCMRVCVCVCHIIHRVRKHQQCTVSKPVIHIFYGVIYRH